MRRNGFEAQESNTSLVHPRTQKSGLKSWAEEFDQRMNELAIYCSMHGFIWYSRVKSKYMKLLAVVILTGYMIGMLCVVTARAVEIYSTLDSVSSTERAKEFQNHAYPNLTICHPKFFNQKLLIEKNVSIEMASYATIMFDPNSHRNLEEFNARHESAQKDLEKILNSQSLTLPELLTSLAIKCTEIVAICDVHGVILNSEECCSEVFSGRPLFTSKGVCYTSQIKEISRVPTESHGVEVWMILNRPDTQYADLVRPSRLKLEGIYFTVTDRHEAPAMAFLENPKIAQPSQHHWLRLTTNVIKRDFTCDSKNQQLFNQHDCELTMVFARQLNCSVAEYMGIEGSGLELLKDQPPCDMKDIIRLRSYNKSDHQSAEKCLPLCTEESTAFSDSVATMSDKAVEDYLPADFGINLRSENLVSIKMYYGTFHYNEIMLSKGDLWDVVSDIGGLMGLLCGASIISIVEWTFLNAFYAWNSTKATIKYCKS